MTICAKAANSINRIRLIRNSLSQEVCQTLVQALVITYLDLPGNFDRSPTYSNQKITKSTNITVHLVLDTENSVESNMETL